MATRACSWCGDPYTPQRWTLDWHNFCSRAHAKAAQRAGRCPGDDAVLLVRPRSLRVAHLALDKGVPFEQLVLSQDERDLLIVSHPDFAGGRLEAATRLMDGPFAKIGSDLGSKAPKVPKLQLDAVRRQLLLVDAVKAAWRKTSVFGVYRVNELGGVERRPGNQHKVDPYLPAESLLEILFFDFLPRELERRAHKLRQQERQQARTYPQPLDPENVEPVIKDGVYSEDGDRPSSKTVFRQPEVRRPRSRHELARDLREIKDELLGFQWRDGAPRQYARPQRPAHPEPFYNAEGEIDPRTKEYRKARARYYEVLKEMKRRRGWTPPTPDPERSSVMGISIETVAAQNEEILSRIRQMQERLEHAFDGIEETVERVRDRFPNDAEVSAAVDRFLDSR